MENHSGWWCHRSDDRYVFGYVHKINQKKSKKSLTFCNSIIILYCNDNDWRKIMDMGTFAIGCLNYELARDAGKLPKDDIEFQAETGIGPVYLNGRPQTRQEQREALEEDGRMTHDEIEEWLDSLEM